MLGLEVRGGVVVVFWWERSGRWRKLSSIRVVLVRTYGPPVLAGGVIATVFQINYE